MTRFLLTGLLALGLAMPGFTQTKEIVKELNDTLDSLRKDDDVLKSVLATHPTIAAARAKVQLAYAELQQAELAIAQQLQTLKVEQEIARLQVASLEKAFNHTKQLVTTGVISDTELSKANDKVNEAKMGLTRVTATYEALIKPTKSDVRLFNSSQALGDYSNAKLDLVRSLEVRPATPSVENPPLSAVINKVVKMEAKGSMQEIVQALKGKVGYLGILRFKQNNTEIYRDARFHIVESGELSFSSWIDLILDEYNTKFPAEMSIDIYVREYGLLIIERVKAPAGAVTLRDFAKAEREKQERLKAERENAERVRFLQEKADREKLEREKADRVKK